MAVSEPCSKGAMIVTTDGDGTCVLLPSWSVALKEIDGGIQLSVLHKDKGRKPTVLVVAKP